MSLAYASKSWKLFDFLISGVLVLISTGKHFDGRRDCAELAPLKLSCTSVGVGLSSVELFLSHPSVSKIFPLTFNYLMEEIYKTLGVVKKRGDFLIKFCKILHYW